MWSLVRADLMATAFKPPVPSAAYWLKVLAKLLVTPQVQVVVLYRIASALARTPLRPLAFVLRSVSADGPPDQYLRQGFPDRADRP